MISESPVGEWLDNPIFVKHRRSRLRPRAFLAGVMAVVLLCVGILGIGFEANTFRTGFPYSAILALQAILLVIMGAGQVGAAVGGARSTGILEFHRISPLTPTELTLGFLFGAPVREYLLFACTLPFVAICSVMGVPTPRGAIQILILIIGTALLLHIVAVLGSLMTKKATSRQGAIGLVVVICIFTIPGLLGAGRFLTMLDADARMSLFGFSIPWLAMVLLNEAALFTVALTASVRKMRSERMHCLSKPQAIAALLAVSILIMGGFWNQIEVEILTLVIVYTLVVVSILFLAVVSPDHGEYTKGLLRARKAGHGRVPWWHDLAWNRGFLIVASLIVLASSTIVYHLAPSPRQRLVGEFTSMPLAIANGVLVVAYVGLAIQYFLLRFRSYGTMFAGVFFFLAWGLPIVAGILLAANAGPGPGREQVFVPFLAMSPILGITLSSAPVHQPWIDQVQYMAILPTLLFTFVFGGLAVSARRRIDREVRASLEVDPEFDTARDNSKEI